MRKMYNRINWKNYPHTDTPINEANLNKMDAAIEDIDNYLQIADYSIKNSVSNLRADENNIVVTKNDGTYVTIPTNEIKDDDGETKYKIGIDNGLLYIEEVTD